MTLPLTTAIFPISDIINVTIENTPQGLTEPNVNSVALFTTDAALNSEVFGEYVSASSVASNYGSNSDTTLMANALFSQVPNVLSGDGQLVIIPLLSSVQATHGNFTTTSIAANISSFAAVTSGSLKVTLNGGAAINMSGLNFTGVTTLAQIAAIIQAQLLDATVTSNSTAIIISSKKVGTAATVALATFAGGTDLTGASYFNVSAGTATAGANSSGETISAAVTRTTGLVGYCGVMSTMDLEDTAIEANAAALATGDYLYLEHCASTTDIAGVCTVIQQATETKTRMLLYTPSMHAAKLYKAAYAGRGFSTDYTGSNTVSTMNLKTLVTITPDPGLNQTLYNAAKVAGCDIYVSYAGVPGVLSTGGNDYFDNQYANLALKFALQTAGFNYLAQTTTKVPQTEPGMNGLKAAYAQVMQQYVTNGELAPGQWNSSETFGDPQVFNNNIIQNGYYIYSQPVAQQSSSNRNNRIAPLVQIAAKRAGAIQSGNVIVIVNS